MADPPAALHDLSAAQAARAIRARQISPVDLVHALLDRAERVDGQILAWETLDPEGALAAARDLEARLARSSSAGPLHGVPVGIKDVFDTAGLRTAANFAPYTDRVPSADAAVVGRLRASGAIILGKTVATQFAFTDPAKTRNPWSADRTPGGSSSGSAAGVAAREVPIAVGSQTAGSTLRPAAYCGVVGFKPTYGRISLAGAFPLSWNLDHVGIIARSVEDCGLFLVATGDRATGASVDDVPLPNSARAGRPSPRLGLLRDALDFADSSMRASVVDVADHLRAAGATVEERRLARPLDLILAAHRVVLTCEASAAYSALFQRHPDGFGPILASTVRVGRLISAPDYLHALRLRRMLTVALEADLEGLDALLLPTATAVAPSKDTTGDPSLQVPASLAGLPSCSLPTGLSADGLPQAIQLVGQRGRDEHLLDVAAWCEAQIGPMPAPPIPTP